MLEPRTDIKTLIEALRILANDIQSNDGVANACIWEAANRLEEMDELLAGVKAGTHEVVEKYGDIRWRKAIIKALVDLNDVTQRNGPFLRAVNTLRQAIGQSIIGPREKPSQGVAIEMPAALTARPSKDKAGGMGNG